MKVISYGKEYLFDGKKTLDDRRRWSDLILWTTEKSYSKYGSYIRVELGPGKGLKSDRDYVAIGLNPSADPNCDVFMNLEDGIPFLNGSVNEIHSNQFLEHISRDRFIFFMNETWRVLRPGGVAEHCVPHVLSPWAFADPTHKNWFTEKSFVYFTKRDGRNFAEAFSDYGIECKFKMEKILVREGIDITVRMRKSVE